MLNLILGRAGTGKTYTVFEKIKADVENGKQVVLLVPEQFTFECERTLLKTLGDRASTNAQVLSFTRLYDEVSRKAGGRVADIINESDRAILMGQALKESADRLEIWGKYANSVKFAQTLLATVSEFKASAVTCEELVSAAQNVKSDYLKAKINDVATVYAAYNALLGNRFSDPQDNMDKLCENLLEYKFFEDKTVYIDSFKNFTGQQYKIIERIISQANDITFCFTAPDLKYENVDIFKGVRDTVMHVEKIAEKCGKRIENVSTLTDFHFKNESLRFIESVFSDNHLPVRDEIENVSVTACDTVYDEAEFTARTIRKLVRKEGYRYRDFVIIARDADKYRKAVEAACKKNDVFCFYDRRRSIKDMPLTVLVSAYLKLLNSYKTDYILEMLRSGLSDLTDEEICSLENYVYIWNIDGKDWEKEWDMNPKGFATVEEKNRKEYSEGIEKLNGYRKIIVQSIKNFRRRFVGTPEAMASAIVRLTEELNVGEKLKGIFGEDGYKTGIDSDVKQGYDAVMQALDGIVKCLPEIEIPIGEFIDNWEVSVNSVTVGNIPQMLDEVTFGSADRIKPSRPKVAFIIGAYQDEFPKTVVSGGVFALNEREALKNAGIDMYSTDISKAVEEDYLVYTSLCCASERIFITYPAFVGTENGILPSGIVNTVVDTFKTSVKRYKEPEKTLLAHNLPETVKSAVSFMCETYNTDKSACRTVEKAVKNTADISVNDFLTCADKKNASISKEASDKLFGNRLSVSATEFETYHKCRFQFFCKYALRARKLEKADLNVLQRGTMVHYALEKLIGEYGKRVSELDRKSTDALIERYIAEYIAQIGGIEDFFDERMKYLFSKLSLLVKDVAFHIVNEFRQSEFSPDYCELKIGDKGLVQSKELVCENGKRVSINGSIDRVDIWNGYVRIVDYKTNSLTFRLSDTLMGLNMQMLLYLYSLARGKSESFNKLEAAGILYVPAKRKREEKDLAMNGIILDDKSVFTAMEKENEGIFIPKHEDDEKKAAKSQTYVASGVFETVFDYIEKLLGDMSKGIENGDMKVSPTDGTKEACKYCDYYAICGNENGEHRVAEKINNAEALAKMKEELL